MASSGSPVRLDALDGWRTISVAMVIVGHLLSFSSIAVSDETVRSLLRNFALLGVQIFFVISGFVICRGFVLERARAGRISLKAFWVRRMLRIVPPLALFFVVILSLDRLGVVALEPGFVRVATFTCNVVGVQCGGYLGGHIWSLSVEEQFYLLFPWLVLLLPRWGIVALAPLVPLLVLICNHTGLQPVATFLAAFVPISVGVASAVLEPWLRRLFARVNGAAILVALAVIVVFTSMHFGRLDVFMTLFGLSPLIAFVLLKSSQPGSPANRLMSYPPLTALGRVSYFIYLWQQLATYPFPGAGPVFYTVAIVTCIAAAFLSFRFLEAPLIAFAKRFSRSVEMRGINGLAQPTAPIA